MSMTVPVGIVVVSDRAARGEYEDLGGPAVEAWLSKRLTTDWTSHLRVVADEAQAIAAALKELCDQVHCGLVLTTGGTGPAPRDITPEVMEGICDRMLPGFGEQMRRASLEVVPTAILSRQTAGHRGASLIINLPGKPSAVADCLNAIFDAVPYCLDLIGGQRLETDPPAWRPKQSPVGKVRPP